MTDLVAETMVETTLQVVSQGAVLVNAAHVCRVNPGNLGLVSVAMVEVDLRTKHAWLDTYSSGHSAGEVCVTAPCFYLSASSYSLHLADGRERGNSTVIALPDLPNWEVFCCSLSRYTLKACLTRPFLPLCKD